MSTLSLANEKRGRRVLGRISSLILSKKYGNMTKKGIRVKFYGEEDVDTGKLTEAQLSKLRAEGIATTGDGYIWINKGKIKDGDTINFNKAVLHELTHQILGNDTEYEARYVERGYESFLKGIQTNGYVKDGRIIDLMLSKLTDEDKGRLNGYVMGDMQFKDLIGVDFRYEDKFNINIVKQNKLNLKKDFRKVSRYEDIENKALSAKRKGKKGKEVEKIYKEEERKIKRDELYKKDRIMSSKEKAFYEHIMKKSNIYTYKIEILGSENGYYLVNEKIINEEDTSRGAVSDREIPETKVTLGEFRKGVLDGKIVNSPGILVTGYGITKEEASRNREQKNEMLLNGIMQTGSGALKAKVGGVSVLSGVGLCTGSVVGCGVGGQLIGSGAGVLVMGANETYVGIQNVGYSLSSSSGIERGKGIEEYTKYQENKEYTTPSNVKIKNPVLNYIVNKGGDERDYAVIGAVTGAMAAELNIYNQNSITKYVLEEKERREKVKEFRLKSPLEKQLEDIGVKSERLELGLKIDGTTKTGLKIDEKLRNNLGRTFKTFDNYESSTGTATSVKSIDLTAKTYQSGSGLSSKIRKDIGATLDFDKYQLDGKYLNSSNINKKVVNIVVDDKPLNQSQIENFKKAVDFGRLNNVEVKVTINGGK